MSYGALNRDRMQAKFRLQRRVRLIRRWWWDASDDFKLGTWIIGVLALGVTIFLTYGLWPRGVHP